MRLLGIDTTKKSAKIFILNTASPEEMCWVEMPEGLKHSESIFLYIEKILIDNQLTIEDLDGFVCVVGPGAFTGIRVGMSTIKGLNAGVNKVVVAINSFELLVNAVKSGYILLNSTTTSCYYAKINKGEIIDAGVVDKSIINDFCDGKDVFVLQEEQKGMMIEYKNIKVIDNLKDLYAKSVMSKVDNGDYGECVPYYLQLSQAERNLKDE